MTTNSCSTEMSPEVDGFVPSGEAGQRQPLRVCTIAYTFYESDGRVMRYDEALAARGDSVDVITLRLDGKASGRTTNNITVFGVQTRKVNERSPISYLVRILRFFLRAMLLLTWRQIRYRYDVVHVHSVPEFLVFVAWLPKLMGAKIILDIHDLLPELYASKFGIKKDSLLFKALLFVERVSVAFADHLITANDLWQEKLVGRCAERSKATVLLNLPDRGVFSPRGRTRSDDKFIVIYPGSLNWHQGLDVAISAMATVHRERPNVEFHIYGLGPSLEALKTLARSLNLEGVVQFKRPLPLREIASVMENADLAVVAKRKDSFGNEAFSTKILELMAMGVPVIVSDTKIDTYYFDGSLVRFFRSGEADDLAICMSELISDIQARESLARNGRNFVESHSWNLKRKVYLDLVDSLVGERVGPRAREASPVLRSGN